MIIRNYGKFFEKISLDISIDEILKGTTLSEKIPTSAENKKKKITG